MTGTLKEKVPHEAVVGNEGKWRRKEASKQGYKYDGQYCAFKTTKIKSKI